MRPFRFGVQLSAARDGRAWRALVRDIEARGYSSVLMPDHFDDQWGPLVGMTIAAEATERLRVGWLVLDNDYRHPVTVAREAATLDLASEGRLEVGVGAGWLRDDYEAAGIPFDPPAVRVERLREALAVMKALWSEGAASFAGRHYSLNGARGLPRPCSRPHPRLLVGGGGRRVLSLAAREADIVGINASLRGGGLGPELAASIRPERFEERVAWVRDAAGERFASLELQVLVFLVQVVPDRLAVAEALGPMFGLRPEEALEVPLALVGTVEEICETLRRRREVYGLSYVVVHENDVAALTAVVERLAGT